MQKIGFIGAGPMGRFQAGAFASVRGCRVAAVADPSAAALAAFAELHPDAWTTDDSRQLFKDPDIDALVIAVPTHHHMSVAIAALKSKKPVLLEKPMARTVAECRRILKQAAASRTFLMVAHCRRFDRNWESWARVVRSGAIGRPVLWRAASVGRGPSAPWFMEDTQGGGPMLDVAIHNYDFANMLFGAPDRVVAAGINLVPEVTAIDTSSAIIQYVSGDQVMLSWSWGNPGAAGMFDIIGPKGHIIAGPGGLPVPKEKDRASGYYCVTNSRGRKRLIKTAADFNMDMYARQARHFLKSAAGKAECISPGSEAIKTIAVGEAILKASRAIGIRKVTW